MTTAALALVAFASCNNDDIFTPSKNAANQPGLSIVSIEEPVSEGVITRSAMDKDVNTMTYWDEDDVINVYDADLYKSDPYTYDATAKKFVGTASNVTAPAFGIYPKASVFGTSNLDDALKLRMDIPSAIEYTTDTEATIDGKTVYASNLPLWSPATKGADGVELTKLRYLTAVLKVWLPNAPGNINYMLIKSTSHKISGAFTAVLDTENADAVQLEEKVKGDAQDNYIFVDLTKVPSNLSVVYLPIIAGTYEANDLAIYMNNAAGTYTEADAATPGKWTAIREFTTGVTLKRAGFYNVKVSESDYAQKADTPNRMTHLLDLYKTQDVLQLSTEAFTINNGGTEGNIIEIPEVTTTEPIVLEIGNNTGTITATTDDLTIQEAEDVDFTGTIIFRNNNGTTTPVNLTVNLPNADVIVAGTFGAKTLTVTAAKSLTIGDGATTTAFTSAIAPTALTEAMTIEGAATVANVTLPAASTKDFELNIKGVSTGTVSAGIATVNMTGYTDAASTVHAATVATLTTTGGDVNIALPTEGEAISTMLNMTADNNNLVVKQGYIKALTVNASTAIANPKNLEVNLNNAGQGLVAFGSIAKGAGAPVINLTESPYVGDFNSIDKTTNFSAYYYPTLKTIYTAQQLAKLNGVYNATAHTMTPVDIKAETEIKLANTIDMKGAQWWGITTSGTELVQFNGYDVLAATKTAQTIKNIDFFAQTITDDDEKTGKLGKGIKRGFFSNAASKGGLTVEKVNFTGVKGAFSYVWNSTGNKCRTLKELGAIVGTSVGAVTLTDVSVAITGDFGLSTVTSGDKDNLQTAATQPNIGGLIGSSAGAVTITNGQVTGAAIKGYGPIGGLVGFLAADNNLTVADNTTGASSAKFTSYAIAYTSGDNSDFNYVKNGAVLGSLAKATTAAAINISNNTAANWTYTFTNPGRSYVSHLVTPNNEEYDFTRDDVNLIGFYAGEASEIGLETFIIGGKTAKVVAADVLQPWAASPAPANLAAWKSANANTLVLYYFTKKTN